MFCDSKYIAIASSVVCGLVISILAMPSALRHAGPLKVSTVNSSFGHPARQPDKIWTERHLAQLVKASPMVPLASAQALVLGGICYSFFRVAERAPALRSLYYSSFSDRAPPFS